MLEGDGLYQAMLLCDELHRRHEDTGGISMTANGSGASIHVRCDETDVERFLESHAPELCECLSRIAHHLTVIFRIGCLVWSSSAAHAVVGRATCAPAGFEALGGAWFRVADELCGKRAGCIGMRLDFHVPPVALALHGPCRQACCARAQ